jgi:hypothetical protein
MNVLLKVQLERFQIASAIIHHDSDGLWLEILLLRSDRY